FTRRGADPACELGEIIGGMQHIERAAPLASVDQVVPVRNDVVDGTAVMAERDAAIHAAGRLTRGAVIVECMDELIPVTHPCAGCLMAFFYSLELQKSGDLAHVVSSGGNVFAMGGKPQLAQCTAVLERHHLHELAAAAFPVIEHVARTEAAGMPIMVLDQAAQNGFICLAFAARLDAVPVARVGARSLFGMGADPLEL